ncbi:MAG: hypothetical protein Q9225_002383 [Loekoesia sp. 1 TL-2023]
MNELAAATDPDDCLDVLGQQPLLKLYTQICFCFPVVDASSHSTVINTLTNGLERLSASFPWLTGQIIVENSSKDNSGNFKIKPLNRIPRLAVKDLRHDPSITMDALKRARFPFSMLDEAIIAPCKTLLGSSDESGSNSIPVFLAQANFIIGGLLLTFVGQHNTMDMIGQGQIIHLFSKACHAAQFTTEELSSGNLARRNLIPLLDDSHEQSSELARQIVKPVLSRPTSDGQPAPPSLPKCTWAYFTFASSSLSTLKSLATSTITLPTSYISTDDVLSGFIWQSVIRARLPRLNPTSESTFARAVDVRHYLNIPKTYPGLMMNMTYHTYTLQRLVEEPLGDVASQLRSPLDPKTSNIGYRTRALATFINDTPNKNIVSFTATVNSSTDIMLSSWAKLDCYELDFNLGLGKPEAVRRPRFPPFESLIYLMPKTLDGEIAVAICLRDEDMERLKADEDFAKYGIYVG